MYAVFNLKPGFEMQIIIFILAPPLCATSSIKLKYSSSTWTDVVMWLLKYYFVLNEYSEKRDKQCREKVMRFSRSKGESRIGECDVWAAKPRSSSSPGVSLLFSRCLRYSQLRCSNIELLAAFFTNFRAKKDTFSQSTS